MPFSLVTHEYGNIQGHLDYWIHHDFGRWYYFQRLRSTADGRYTFVTADLNDLVNRTNGVDVRPESFRHWARRVLAPGGRNAHPLGSTNAMQLD